MKSMLPCQSLISLAMASDLKDGRGATREQAVSEDCVHTRCDLPHGGSPLSMKKPPSATRGFSISQKGISRCCQSASMLATLPSAIAPSRW